ncbi:TetR family transcriptional regulator [Amycolatopsis sp., V23-08]|uniref:TetR family transcriptional regulator n=1 Tax=Amycolatopsis heterodermiae TaxID=3110235 RepID=A0ABU5R7U7_9PSEU|nr:TetR family transcriptional regulator [Amycolatopsis sp., V23-08]MEA5362312.1 TetR family transcriptional regulator [Amycolatopsis sp., V23-08]
MTGPGLRERKKQQTRDALVDTAYELFRERGYDSTTVDEIAAAVNISPRTFFRYFTSKEDVALAPLDQQLTEVMTALAARPAAEPLVTAIRNASAEVLRAYETGEEPSKRNRHRSMEDLLAATPALMAACLGRSTSRLDELAGLLARRLGVDPRLDPRPHLVASISLCAVRTTVGAWREIHPETPASDLVRQAFDLLATGLNHPAN